jgi:sterol 3beta-glucosyltransferase
MAHNFRFKSNEINTDIQRWDPVTGSVSSLMQTATNMTVAASGVFLGPHSKYQEAHRRSKANGTEINGASTAGAMVASSAKNLARIYTTMLKGTIVDLPLAVTEGLQMAPKLYGEKVQDHGNVTDWKSGFVVAGKVRIELHLHIIHY